MLLCIAKQICVELVPCIILLNNMLKLGWVSVGVSEHDHRKYWFGLVCLWLIVLEHRCRHAWRFVFCSFLGYYKSSVFQWLYVYSQNLHKRKITPFHRKKLCAEAQIKFNGPGIVCRATSHATVRFFLKTCPFDLCGVQNYAFSLNFGKWR